MASCYELQPCTVGLSTIYVASSVTAFLPLVNSYVNISGSCYQVKQSSTASNCSTTVSPPSESFETCLECQGNLQALCGECPEYYVLQEIDGQTVCVKDQGTVDASFTGTLGNPVPGNTDELYNLLGLNILEDITNKTWPVVGGQNSLTGQWWTPLSNPNGGSTAFIGGVGNGFFGNYVFRENWFDGPIVYGDTGYSFFSNTPVGSTAQNVVDKKKWCTNLFASQNDITKGRLNYGIQTASSACSGAILYYPNPAQGLTGFVTPSSTCNISTRLDVCFDVPETRQYLIGFSADNEIRLLIKEPGDLVEKPLFLLKGQSAEVPNVSVYRATSATDNNATSASYFSANSVGWGQYHIVPITLQQGANTITVIGINYNDILSFVCDIINLTLPQFKTQFLDPVTGPNKTLQDLANVCIFSTQRYRAGANNPFNPDNLPIPQVPVTSGTYYCPDGSVVSCDPNGIPQCPIISIIPFSECCYKLTDCVNSNEIYTTNDLKDYQGQYVNIDGGTDCYLVQQLNTACPSNTQTVTISNSFSSCDACRPSFKLFNCKDINVTIQTAESFENYLTKTIKLTEYPNDCWQVGPNADKALPLQPVTLSGSPFETCAECNPPQYGLTNCVNGAAVLSNTDLSAYIGKVIKADNFPGLCFTVTEGLCNCLKVTLTNQVYSVDKASNLYNGKVYFEFTTTNDIPIVIAYNSQQNRWEAYNPNDQTVYFTSSLNIDCPVTGFWEKQDPNFSGNMATEVCPLSILNISPGQEYNNCEPCVNC